MIQSASTGCASLSQVPLSRPSLTSLSHVPLSRPSLTSLRPLLTSHSQVPLSIPSLPRSHLSQTASVSLVPSLSLNLASELARSLARSTLPPLLSPLSLIHVLPFASLPRTPLCVLTSPHREGSDGAGAHTLSLLKVRTRPEPVSSFEYTCPAVMAAVTEAIRRKRLCIGQVRECAADGEKQYDYSEIWPIFALICADRVRVPNIMVARRGEQCLA
jgi:hypothetical protein